VGKSHNLIGQGIFHGDQINQLRLFQKLSLLIFMCYNVWNRIFAENAPKILKNIPQNMNVRMLSNKT
jgi:hypothetical protein